jgi:hypothetical protein
VAYYYVVAARNQAGVSMNSDPVKAQPASAGPLPPKWTHTDIGKVRQSGSATFAAVSQNTFIAKGAGGDIGGKSDALNFTHCVVTGDFVFTARLVIADWGGGGKIGITVRESLAPDARDVALTLGQVGNRQCRFWTRAEAGAAMTVQAGNDYTWLPVWFKIQRAGDVFTGYQSVDGTNWFKVGSSTVTLTNQCLAGLAVTGGKTDSFNTTVFDHVDLQSASK